MENQSTFKKYKSLILFVGLLLAAVVIGLLIAAERVETFTNAAALQAAEQQAVLNTIAETIARNGADSVTESIIKDCAIDDRSRFDALLGQLDQGLSYAELGELDTLFAACASFFADRKALMVARFDREIEVYEKQVALLDSLTTVDSLKNANVAQWNELLAEEQTQSDLFADLVQSQRKIIEALLAGKSIESEEIQAVLRNVPEIREALVFSRQKATTIRESLTAL